MKWYFYMYKGGNLKPLSFYFNWLDPNLAYCVALQQ